ncbi:cohesin subunit rad21, putative [Entamoeba invadens IP1]|uniref:cohesin subunit rad21, putative n=1 Tax=Entamoeba invadens IP1 TaxID=370355 RepID=UPI0002C3D8C4|nr:cohesin subunit rad21, putative [Entamoeba invadens IP1]ELP93551.1 cohesin subunit rad21, putative [Entamoeba invadens IP1]|eukprot:XP_004260322.1 cohesin subunit rad21, putative [Entamoeba invadens IP1]
MFYSQVVLTKKGPLAKVWIAAHWEGKLTKQQILQVDLREAANAVANPEIPIALRISGHLLLGICRIYTRKVKYLLQDCNDALVKIKLSFRPGAVDAEKAVAPRNAITIPTRQRDFSEESTADVMNFANLALDLQLDEQLNAADVIDATGNYTANAQDITMQQEVGQLVGMGSMDEVPLNTLDELLNDPDVLRTAESIMPTELIHPVDKELIETTMGGLASAVSGEENLHDSLNEPKVSLLPEVPTDLSVLPDNQEMPEVEMPVGEMEVEIGLNDNNAGTTELKGDEKIEEKVDDKKKKGRKEKKIIVDKATAITKKRYTRAKNDTESMLRDFDLAPGSIDELREEGRRLRGRWENVNKRILNYVKEANKDEVVVHEIKEVEASQKEKTEEAKRDEELPRAIEGEVKPIKRKSQGSQESSEEKRRVEDVIPNEIMPLQDDMPDVINNDFMNEPPLEQHEDIHEMNEEEKKQKTVTDSWTMRSAKIHNFLKKAMGDKKEMSYKTFVEGKRRKPVVGCFFELLVLKTQGVIDLEQQTPYDDIVIKQTNTFLADVETAV